ncbi:MAG: M15 family metallopeptidase, partial [Clostridia bacterium]|nr:M15 family metallopeptidase [Clostridia bacterium]
YSVSDYRSYALQSWLYQTYVDRDGKELADTYSARPGHSEHQTGRAIDLNATLLSFADTPEGQWLAAHCWEYGFIIRYPAGKESVTGFMYEPWHVRYVGTWLSIPLRDSGQCLEEYFGITSVYDY